MKNISIKKLSFIVLPALLLGSCKKSFLDVDPQGQTTEVLALTDPDAAAKLVGGVYNTLYFGGFGNTTVGFLWQLTNDIASDDADKGSTPGDFNSGGMGDIDNFIHTPNSFIFNNIWSGHFNAIISANKAIEVLGKSTIDAGTKNRLLGESRFLRGLYYFNLVRFFGGVPKITTAPLPSEGNSDALNTRATAAEIYALIIEDLQFAVDNLPMKGDAATQTGRANKGAAQAYLAKVYLYQKNWAKVLELTNAIIVSNKYSLVTDYNLIHREKPVGGQGGNNNSESIFEVQTGLNAGENAVSPLFSNGQGPRGRGGWNDLGFGFNTPTSDLASFYEAGDTRRGATIMFINPTAVAPAISTGTVLWDGYRVPSKDSVENERYSYKAYHSPIAESPQVTNNKDTKPKNIRLMRYAEVLLMYAEASAMGAGGDGVNKLSMVRGRSGLLPTTLTQANVWNERRAELAMEADRFFDLVRQGRAGTVLRAHGKPFVDGKHELFPIPQAQRDLSGNRLTQNPNY
ncbi:RagB/SusD family nutrient uptake outer membrane protein [Chitinophagaceae bacterium IBVUCB2]|nr:RagB/SusD family nutrient uptake outer membrane protein [Chitinophagaceae bacterium IBVUCB2]